MSVYEVFTVLIGFGSLLIALLALIIVMVRRK
ncbi:putative holin-like toxin [Virgibacillus flavescens]